MINPTTIEAVKSSSNVYDVISEYVHLKKEGTDYVGLCPFHNEKTPSFKVSPSKNIYKCFGCGVFGDAIEFIKEHKKISFTDSVKLLASKYNINVDETMTEGKKKYEKPIPRLEKLSPQIIERYEKVRCISNNTLLRFNVTQSIEWMPKAQKNVIAINYNYYQDGELVNIKFKSANKDFKLAKDAKLIFYNIDSIKDTDEAICVEGEEDAHTFYECGEYAVVSVPNGANVKGNVKLEYLDNCYEYFEDKKRIYIATDGDEAGRRLCEELSRRLGKERCYIVQYPQEPIVPIISKDGEVTGYRPCKDANEVLVFFGKQAVLDLKNNAKLYPLEGESTMDDIKPLLTDYYLNGYPNGANCGLLDKEIGYKEGDGWASFSPKQLTLVGGISRHGKDEFLNAMCVGLALNSGWKTAIFQFEETTEITASKILEKYTDKAFDFRKNPDNRMTYEQFNNGLEFVEEYFKFVNVDEITANIDGILEMAKKMILRYGINSIVISPFNCLEGHAPAGMLGTDYILLILNKITSFIKKYNIHCFLVAHPRKMTKNQQGLYEVPTLQDFIGSIHFENKCHNGITVYRNFLTNLTEVHIQKFKHYWLGEMGLRQFVYDTQTRQYLSQYATTEDNKPITASSYKPITLDTNFEQGKFFVKDNSDDIEPF